MGIAVKSQPVGLEANGLKNRLPQAIEGLERQAVDQVEIDGGEPQFAGIFRGTAEIVKRLYPVDRLLYLFIEVLHTIADATESKPV